MQKDEIDGISIVIPTLNEEGNIKKLIERIALVFYNANYKYEIIIVDDNSSDGTQSEVEKIIANRTEQNRTEQNRTEQNRTEQNRTEQYLLIC